ncbi:MAG: 2-C-methyl-D-erythritol 2,4-cyclodiphosphate synthase [Actinomycetes bacterium]
MIHRVGLGFDVHPFGGDGPLVLGGVTIDGPGLDGHSDADVVAHAVADALLGPAGLPDLGARYPASDERWAGARSVDLLADVAAAVAREGWWLQNVDVVVAAEAPRLGPHLAAMAETVAAALVPLQEPMGVPLHVAVTPKRGEGLGFVGRVEGIACWAVAMLSKG